MEHEETTEEGITESGLTVRQERFCMEYLKDFNATAAAKRTGYLDKSAHCTGSRILALPLAKQFLKAEIQKMNVDIRMASEAVNKELLNIAYLNRGEFLDESGDLKNLKDLPENLRAAVQVQTKKIKNKDKETTVTTYSLFNKIQMMEKIGRRSTHAAQAADETDDRPAATEDLGGGISVKV